MNSDESNIPQGQGPEEAQEAQGQALSMASYKLAMHVANIFRQLVAKGEALELVSEPPLTCRVKPGTAIFFPRSMEGWSGQWAQAGDTVCVSERPDSFFDLVVVHAGVEEKTPFEALWTLILFDSVPEGVDLGDPAARLQYLFRSVLGTLVRDGHLVSVGENKVRLSGLTSMTIYRDWQNNSGLYIGPGDVVTLREIDGQQVFHIRHSQRRVHIMTPDEVVLVKFDKAKTSTLWSRKKDSSKGPQGGLKNPLRRR